MDFTYLTGVLSGPPFFPNIENEYEVVAEYSASGKERYTTVNITVLQQYLNKSLSIQCGLCSGSICYIVRAT